MGHARWRLGTVSDKFLQALTSMADCVLTGFSPQWLHLDRSPEHDNKQPFAR